MWVQTHDQAVDPNLVRLAEAYEVAATTMKSNGAHEALKECIADD